MKKALGDVGKGWRFTIIIFVLLALAGVFLIFMSFVLRSEGKILNYYECEKAPGSRIQESYPRVCVTKDGVSHVNPEDRPVRGTPLRIR